MFTFAIEMFKIRKENTVVRFGRKSNVLFSLKFIEHSTLTIMNCKINPMSANGLMIFESKNEATAYEIIAA